MKSVKSSPNRPVHVDIQRKKHNRLDSPRASMTSQTKMHQDKPKRQTKPHRNPMKSSLSTVLKQKSSESSVNNGKQTSQS